MKILIGLVSIILGAFAVETPPIALAQNPASQQQATPTGSAAYPEMMKQLTRPGDNHKLLGSMVGRWDFTGRHFSDDPKEKPFEFKGIVERKSLWEGRYFVAETTGEGKLQMPWSDGREITYKDMSVEGYDNVKKKFVRAIIDNHFDTGILMFEGDYDSANKTITYNADIESAPGQKIKTRILLKILDSDHYVEEFYENQGKQEVKVTELSYTRAKAT
jgi:Protein of unknown function (DUF1579)